MSPSSFRNEIVFLIAYLYVNIPGSSYDDMLKTIFSEKVKMHSGLELGAFY